MWTLWRVLLVLVTLERMNGIENSQYENDNCYYKYTLTSPEPEGRLPQGSVTLAHFVYCWAWCCHIGSCHFSFTPISMIYNAGWVTLPSKLFLSHYFVCPALGLSGIYVSRQVYFCMFSDIILSFIRLKWLNFLISKSGYSISFLITVCNVL